MASSSSSLRLPRALVVFFYAVLPLATHAATLGQWQPPRQTAAPAAEQGPRRPRVKSGPVPTTAPRGYLAGLRMPDLFRRDVQDTCGYINGNTGACFRHDAVLVVRLGLTWGIGRRGPGLPNRVRVPVRCGRLRPWLLRGNTRSPLHRRHRLHRVLELPRRLLQQHGPVNHLLVRGAHPRRRQQPNPPALLTCANRLLTPNIAARPTLPTARESDSPTPPGFLLSSVWGPQESTR